MFLLFLFANSMPRIKTFDFQIIIYICIYLILFITLIDYTEKRSFAKAYLVAQTFLTDTRQW